METSEWAVRGTHEVSYSRPPVPGSEARRVGYCHGGFPRVLENQVQLLCFFFFHLMLWQDYLSTFLTN